MMEVGRQRTLSTNGGVQVAIDLLRVVTDVTKYRGDATATEAFPR
jgi:hypothetical protein